MTRHFELPHHVDAATALAALASGRACESDPPRALRRRYFDSFDWRLHEAGLALVHEGGRWQLVRLDDDVCEAEAAAETGGSKWPRFAADFPAAGGLRDRLASLLKMRAVIHLATVTGEVRTWRILNEDRKIILRLDVSQLAPEKPRADVVLDHLRLRPLRGYDEALADAIVTITEMGGAPAPTTGLNTVLAAVGITPRGYSSRFRVALDGAASALHAATVIARELRRTLRRNVGGVLADIDTEFLHDFRVAVRRQRSAFAHFDGVFDPESLAPFRDHFAALGRVTGPLRDLDVWLLDEAAMRARLPEQLRPGLDELFMRLAERRAMQLDEVRRVLSSAEFREFLAAWDRFLAHPAAGAQAGEPAAALLRERLRKRHRRVLRDGRAITDASPDEDLHRLRIQCKKLRYLLEFARPLVAGDVIGPLIRHLKGLQDNLGEFNDLSVQQEALRHELTALEGDGPETMMEAAALGGLIAALAGRHREVRGEFKAAFGAFDRGRVNRAFRSLWTTDDNVDEGDGR